MDLVARKSTPPADMGMFPAGSQFGPYVVGPCIGRGGMARIYRAEHKGLRRQVALKVLTEGIAHDAEGRERFLREARTAAAIKHPNVVNIFDVGVEQGTPYLVMELLEGQDLENLLEVKGALDENTVIAVIVPVLAGLAAVHDAGVIHRDLKPGNIFLARGRNDELEPKVLDFGMSKAVGVDQLRVTSGKTHLLGTPFYLSPEAIQGHDVSAAADQYSLGVLLYECATGANPFEQPFETQTVAEVLSLITSGQYLPPRARNSLVSEPLAKIIERAMHLNPAERFPNLRQMGRELLLLADQRTRVIWGLSFGVEIEGVGTHATARVPFSLAPMSSVTDKPPSPRNASQRRAWTLGIALFLVIAAVWIGWTRGFGRAPHAPALSRLGKPGQQVIVHAAQPAPPQPAATRAEGPASEAVQGTASEAAATDKALAGDAAQVRATGAVRAAPQPPRSTGRTQPAQSQAAAGSGRFPVGTNGAPILD